jgi:tetrahydromethanopterin S-methyltransferase subunit G
MDWKPEAVEQIRSRLEDARREVDAVVAELQSRSVIGIDQARVL